MEELEQGTDKADFFDELRFWSRTKLRVLEKYIDAYLRKRGRSHQVVYYVDGFAGQGTYGRESRTVEEGSPLRLARLAQRIKDEGKPYRLVCLNVERNKKRCANLESSLAEFDPDIVQTFCGSFTDHLPRIISIMGRAPIVCFLDPFGVVGVSVEDIRPLLQRADTEILLNLSTPTLHRLAGFATSDAKDARGKFNQLSRTLGEDPRDSLPEWLHMRERLSSEKWEEWAVQRYLEQMRMASPHLKYGLAYPVRKTHGGAVKYYLIFASRAMDAFPLMSDFVCSEEDELALQAEMSSRPLGQMSFLVPAHVSKREERYTDVMEEIHAYGLAPPRLQPKATDRRVFFSPPR